ncbi:choline-binding protein [Enterocloster sp. OA13]|uniref:choline-binding protein n=1 Tax=Enterocloster sp. OA13 TaxID=2914161 RepID=UPI00046FDC9A|nr:choline-binding protein [Enterocloster sp. OA13]
MLKKQLVVFGMAMALSVGAAFPAFADASSSITMENSGAYLFEWRPVDCGDGVSFAILVGGNTINESNVILNRGYDYAYTFEPATYSRPWGTVPDLVNVDGVWAIPENWPSLPEGAQPTLQIVLKTNYKNLDTDKRYIHVVHLPGNVDSSSLPPEVRKYLINVDGSDAGAYEGTETAGWVQNDSGQWTFRKPDGSYVSNSWLTVDEKTYYMDENGVRLTDTYAPDGTYVNPNGEKVSYKPGWVSDEKGWRYIQKNGYYAAATWIQDTDGKWYYFNIGAYMAVNTTTPDGFYVDESGVWNGESSTISNNINPGPGGSGFAGWENTDNGWKYKQEDGAYVTNAWKQADGKWYYFDENSLMVIDQQTPDGYNVNSDGVWVE